MCTGEGGGGPHLGTGSASVGCQSGPSDTASSTKTSSISLSERSPQVFSATSSPSSCHRSPSWGAAQGPCQILSPLPVACTGQFPCNLQTHFIDDSKSSYEGNRVGALGDQRLT